MLQAANAQKYSAGGSIVWSFLNVLGADRDRTQESTMKRLIRYRTNPEQAAENAGLVTVVFAELGQAKPEGLRYLTLRLDDDTFVHLVDTDAADGTSALPQLGSFQAFQQGIRDRCAEPPLVRQATVVGNYRMLNER
jgi:hypothetical protein